MPAYRGKEQSFSMPAYHGKEQNFSMPAYHGKEQNFSIPTYLGMSKISVCQHIMASNQNPPITVYFGSLAYQGIYQ
jgi:hypothetical protein